ncbi:MAG: CPBP family intramembrane metalloprotease [Deltaproteobacteria bacterium]|nr:MAG: CPBP family intramembrane metalloprotease [Deltaproteobacteria bacterium]
MTPLRWDPASAPVVVLVATATVCYLAFFILAGPAAARRLFRPADDDALRTAVAFWRRGVGVVLLGVVPLLVLSLGLGGDLAEHGLTLRDPGPSLAFAAATLALMLPILALQARRPWFHRHYPEARLRAWTRGHEAANALSWLAYLVAYEAFFRGFLLFGLAHALGPWPAIAITTAAYVFVHLTKNAGEAVGSLVMGLVYGFVALHTGSILMPLVAHWVSAVAADTWALSHHPEMTRT